LALNESASINAFILVFIFKNWTFGAILFTASIIAFLLKFPKEEKNLEKNPTGLDA
jgi:protein-S-isoprenylcysteine O-methyltransferase Ste14